MGLGSTAKKIQALAERAEQLYEQVIELRERIVNLEESVDATTDRVQALEVESEKQTVILRAVAEQQGVDVDQVLADAAIEEAEERGDDTADAAQSAAGGEGAADAAGGDGEASTASDSEPTVVDESGEPVE